jgi:hypothetical protein
LEDWTCDICENEYEHTDRVQIFACRDFDTCDWCVCSACVMGTDESDTDSPNVKADPTETQPEPEPEPEPKPKSAKGTVGTTKVASASRGGLLGEFRRAQDIPAADLSSSDDDDDDDDEDSSLEDDDSEFNRHRSSARRWGGEERRPEQDDDDDDLDWPRRSAAPSSSERPRRNYRAGVAGLLEQCRDFHSQDRPAECLVIAAKILDMDPQHDVALAIKGKKTGFLSHLYIKGIFLPRQARDKHRKTQKEPVFSKAGR